MIRETAPRPLSKAWTVPATGSIVQPARQLDLRDSPYAMSLPFIRIRNRIINVQAISYVRFYDELGRIDIRLLGPAQDLSLTVTVEGKEAVPVREFFLNSSLVKDLRPEN